MSDPHYAACAVERQDAEQQKSRKQAVVAGADTLHFFGAHQNARDTLTVTALRLRLSLTGYAAFTASVATQVRRRLS
jgi:hypothetical protein